ncbi:MAG: histidine kinase [bacterium]|nr:histidine kinase [bacterium]
MRAGTKVLLLLALVALVPALTLAGLSLGVVRNMASTAGEHSRVAVEQEARRRLVARAVDLAHAHDTFFGQVHRRAEALADYVQWLYHHPGYYPPFLPGGSPLERAGEGHWLNAAGTEVGVFIPRTVEMTAARWGENGLLSQVDPFLAASADRPPDAAGAWVITASGILRVYPNPGFGHPGSPVGPGDDPRDWAPFQAATGEAGSGSRAVWSPPYSHPNGAELISAVAPVRGPEGELLAIAGVDVVLGEIMAEDRVTAKDPAFQTFLADPGGRLVTAPPNGLGLERGSLLDNRPDLAGRVAAVDHTGQLIRLEDPGSPAYLALARLPEAGWLLGVLAPSATMEASAWAVRAEIRAAEALLLRRWEWALVGILLGVGVSAHLATLALTRPIGRLVEETRRLGEDLSHRLPETGRDELADLARALNRMAEQLQSSRREAVEAAREAGEERQRALRAREIAILEERNRLAREIHDTLAQGLTAMVLQLEAAEDTLGEDLDEVRSRVLRARELARDSLQEARRSVWNLRPQALAMGGLVPALGSLALQLEADGVRANLTLADLDPPPPVAEALYRIAQEAVANVRRHSRATHVDLVLAKGARNVELSITDNGQGFAAQATLRPGGGFGLWAMRERAETVGGQLTVASSPGEGTRVLALVPLEEGDGDGPGDPGADR